MTKKRYALCYFSVGERHLAAVIAEKTDDGSEKDDQDKIERVGYGRVQASPGNQDHLKNEKKDRELNLPFYKKSQFQPVIDPPGQKTCYHGEG